MVGDGREWVYVPLCRFPGILHICVWFYVGVWCVWASRLLEIAQALGTAGDRQWVRNK